MPRRTLKWRVTYRIGVNAIPVAFRGATNIISDWLPTHIKTIQCGEAISVIYVWRVTYRIGVHSIPDSFSCQRHKLSGIVSTLP